MTLECTAGNTNTDLSIALRAARNLQVRRREEGRSRVSTTGKHKQVRAGGAGSTAGGIWKGSPRKPTRKDTGHACQPQKRVCFSPSMGPKRTWLGDRGPRIPPPPTRAKLRRR